MLVSANCSALTCSMLLTLSSALEQPTAVNTKEFQLETHQISMHHLKQYLYNSNNWVSWLPILCQTVCWHLTTHRVFLIYISWECMTCSMHTHQKLWKQRLLCLCWSEQRLQRYANHCIFGNVSLESVYQRKPCVSQQTMHLLLDQPHEHLLLSASWQQQTLGLYSV